MSVPGPQPVTRLAPSPTGALHLGNARTFLVNWALARRRGWSIVLRIEDLDGPRVKPGAIDATVDTLRWLGIDWDSGPIVQSDDLEPYRAAMRSLAARALAYPSALTRTEIEAAASAPQEGVHESPFPASLRPPLVPREFDDESTNWRFVVTDGPVPFVDAFAGPQAPDPSRSVGDFAVWTRRGQPSYQLAVVVDDHRQGITQIVRGDDLIDSAARQLLIYRALGLGPEPTYTHLPLIRGEDGRRLAKRHGDTRIDAYRRAGVRPERVLGLLARWCGLAADEIAAPEFAARLEPGSISRDPVVFTQEDHRWLLAQAR
jgi:glutamyl-tRNA synthetase